jgi:hypothetical protein
MATALVQTFTECPTFPRCETTLLELVLAM